MSRALERVYKSTLTKFLRKIASKKMAMYAPFMMLGVTLLTSLVRFSDNYYEIFNYLSQIIGYSILTGLVFLRHAIANRYCTYSLISIYSLLLLNTTNIVAIYLKIDGAQGYVSADTILTLCLFSLAFYKYINYLKNR